MRIRGLASWVFMPRRTRKRIISRTEDMQAPRPWLRRFFGAAARRRAILPPMPPNKKHLFFFSATYCFAAAATLCAQAIRFQALLFRGIQLFLRYELLAASGVAAGASLDQAGMQAAAQRLNDSGMFATMRFSFNGRELHYELTPATNLLPARFANFPWWDEKDLSSAT